MKIEELHDRLFDVLCTVDDICKKEGVRYFLDGGTMLGSVREKDFIPWDDDMDLQVLAEDYPAFKAAMLKDLPEHMHLVEPDVFAPGFYDFIVRIYDDRWTIRRETEEERYYKGILNHVGTDVFILAHISESPLKQKMAYAHMLFLYGLGMGHRYSLDLNKYRPPVRGVVWCLSRVGKLLPVKWIWKRFCKAIERWNRKRSPLRFGVMLMNFHRQKSAWFETTAQGEIRGRQFPIPGGYDAQLREYYGDYTKPPKDRLAYIQHLDEEDRYQD